MRIIAGSAGGVPLQTARGDVRPTTDRVRESLFSMLGDLTDATVLDLFGGCGTLGLEALSRGAVSAVFVEANRAAAATIESNAKKASLHGARIVNRDVFAWLKQAETRFSLIFADPPWFKQPKDRDFTKELLNNARLPDLLATDGLLVMEEYARATVHPAPAPWVEARQKQLGDTRLRFLRIDPPH